VQLDLYDDGISTFRRILEVHPRDADSMAYIAHCLYMQDKIKAARDMAKKCLLFSPDHEDAERIIQYCDERLR
jgi:tetratricopeptide (TPR) repeat protein